MTQSTEQVDLPIATYKATYGLDKSGHPILEEEWSTPDGAIVPMITKAGMLEMAKQSLIVEIIE